jgi:hypothetical protein
MIRPISTIAAFLRPMYCASTPSGKAHQRAGQDRHRDHEALLRGRELLNSSLMKGAMAPFSTQMAKQKSK